MANIDNSWQIILGWDLDLALAEFIVKLFVDDDDILADAVVDLAAKNDLSVQLPSLHDLYL